MIYRINVLRWTNGYLTLRCGCGAIMHMQSLSRRIVSNIETFTCPLQLFVLFYNVSAQFDACESKMGVFLLLVF